jgi:hypothetical protein
MRAARVSKFLRAVGNWIKLHSGPAPMWRFIRDWAPWAATAVGGILMGLAGGAANAQGKLVFPFVGWQVDHAVVAWVAVPLLVPGVVFTFVNERDRVRARKQLVTQTEKAKLNARAVTNLINSQLDIICTSLDHLSSERVTLFVRVGDHFEVAGRWSAHPGLRGKTRSQYPEEGCLGTAWGHRKSIVVDLPDPKTELQAWLAKQQEMGVSNETALAMTMRSRNYAGFRVDDLKTGRDPSGVVVFESELALDHGGRQRIRPEELERVVDKERPRLRVLLDEKAKLIEAEGRA